MANSFYSYSAYILPSSDADSVSLKNYIEDFYKETSEDDSPEIVLENDQIQITFNDEYNFYIYLSTEAHVNIEAVEIAEDLENDWNEEPFDKEELKTSKKRFEVWGDQDFDMDYFNDSLYLIDQIEKFKDVIIFQNQ